MKCNDSFAGRYEYGVFTSVMWIAFFFFSKCMVGDLINVLHGRRKKGRIPIERQACFFLCIIRPGSRTGAGLFMIHCWYTMSMMFSNGWRGTESTLLRHLFCKTGGTNGREWVKVTGGFPRRALGVDHLRESSCSLRCFLKTFFAHTTA